MKICVTLIFIALSYISVSGQNIPVDFESTGNGADWNWRTFENASDPALEIIDNPDPSGLNRSSKVAKFTALRQGQPFAGCESMHNSDIGTFTIDAASSTIRILIWKSVISDVGIKLVRADNWSLGEIKVANSVVNEWEQLEFDFSEHIGLTYDQIVIFPDFANRQADNIIYFDDIYGKKATTNTDELVVQELKIYPNPVENSLNIETGGTMTQLEIFSIDGLRFEDKNGEAQGGVIDISAYPAGIYILKVIIDGQHSTERFVKS